MMTYRRRRLGRLGSPGLWGGLGLAAFAGLGATSWLSPTTTVVTSRPHSIVYEVGYRIPEPIADPIAGAMIEEVYGPAGVGVEDTIFLTVIDRLVLDIAVDPRSDGTFTGATPVDITGRLSSSAGWSHEFVATTAEAADDGVTRAEIGIDFDEMAATIDRLDQMTGTTGTYSLLVDIIGSTTGTLEPPGVRLNGETSTMSIGFALTATTATPISTFPTVPTSTPVGGDGLRRRERGDTDDAKDAADAKDMAVSAGQPGRRVVTQMLTAESVTPRRILIGGSSVGLETVRWALGLVGFLLGLMALAALVRQIVRDRRLGEAERLLDRHGRRMLPLARWNDHLARYAVDVGSFDALETISVASEQPIMFVGDADSPTDRADDSSEGGERPTDGGCRRFVVVDGSNVFVYRATDPIGTP